MFENLAPKKWIARGFVQA